MRTLILSCNTGAGHNSCARAIQEVYQSRGETCDVIDALLFISKRASKFISNWHTRIYLHAPKFFSAGYEKAEEKDTDMRAETAQDGEFNGMSHEIFNEWVYGKVNDEEY